MLYYSILTYNRKRDIMIKIKFKQSDIDKLEWERYNHPNPNVQRKMEALYLKSQNLPHKTIARLCNISSVTLTTYLKQYRDGGIDRLKLRLHKGKINEINNHRELLVQYFVDNPPSSTKEALKIILEQTGIKRSITQVREFLKRNGFSYRKTAAIPGKAIDDDFIAKQTEFKENKLDPILDEAKMGTREVFFWMQSTSCKDRS